MSQARTRLRFSLRTLFAIVVVSALGMKYVASYYSSSRRGMREASALGLEGFLYVPFDDVKRATDLTHHHHLVTFYAPLNWLDRQVFGGDHPVRSITWELGNTDPRYPRKLEGPP